MHGVGKLIALVRRAAKCCAPPALIVCPALAACGGPASSPNSSAQPPADCSPRTVTLEEPTDIGGSLASVFAGALGPQRFERVGLAGGAPEAHCLSSAPTVNVELAPAGPGTSRRCTPEFQLPVVQVPVLLRLIAPGCLDTTGVASAGIFSSDHVDLLANGTLADPKSGDLINVVGRFGKAPATLDIVLWPKGQPEPRLRAHFARP